MMEIVKNDSVLFKDCKNNVIGLLKYYFTSYETEYKECIKKQIYPKRACICIL